MEDNIENTFYPTIAIAPGSTIQENMCYFGLEEKELALKLEMSQGEIRQLLDGTVEITPSIALKLTSVFGSSDEFWLALEKTYQSQKEKLDEKSGVKENLK